MEVQKIHPAEEYLRNEKNPTSLYVRISGERRKLFINRSDGEGVIGIIVEKSEYAVTVVYLKETPNIM